MIQRLYVVSDDVARARAERVHARNDCATPTNTHAAAKHGEKDSVGNCKLSKKNNIDRTFWHDNIICLTTRKLQKVLQPQGKYDRTQVLALIGGYVVEEMLICCHFTYQETSKT